MYRMLRRPLYVWGPFSIVHLGVTAECLRSCTYVRVMEIVLYLFAN